MRKEIYNNTTTFGNEGKSTIGVIAEYEDDEFQISPTAEPSDKVKISVKEGDHVIHSVFIGIDDLEAIYLAAMAQKKTLSVRLEEQIAYAEAKMSECAEGSPMHSFYTGMLEAYNDCLQAITAPT